MMIILMFSSLSLSMMMIMLKHPLSMGSILLAQTTTVALITGMISPNYWYSYMLFIIMIGGMMVLFMYMTSVASNEKFKFSTKLTAMLFITWTMTIIIYMIWDQTLPNLLNSAPMMQETPYFFMSLTKFINMPTMMISIMLIIYLFITLVAIVKIVAINHGPLRTYN